MKKRILKAGAASVALLSASVILAAPMPEPGACAGWEARSASDGDSCVKVMHAALVMPSKVERRQPAQDDGLPEPGGWAMLLAGLFGVLAIARRRVS